ncbi:unnamed protein product [Hymenolepis diminuta]|uniref:Eukaryotic translation initiation factor 3 subunit G n=1 Tax=Hymenolepis diminuta TaxID=6216 RepID=A0A0R3S8A9_HYMDI|nr:unnamed protein product [Hymenolepis diminuta]
MSTDVAVIPPGALPKEQVIYDREKNTKTVISYELDDDGEYKITKEYTIQRVRVSAAVAKRKEWKKYGDAKDDPPGPNSANTYPGEILDVGGQGEDDASAKVVKPKQAVTCRICKGAHFSSQCPFRVEMEALRSVVESTVGSDSQAPDAMTKAAVQEIGSELNTGRYIPPSLRAAAAAGGIPERSRPDNFSVRVTNLPEDTSEKDLRELFEPFGHIVRVYSAMDKKTNKSRGFAFISYRTKEEAAAAIYSANGMPYSNLILKVDWAQ